MLYAFCCLQTQENEPATLARLFHCGFLRPLPPTEIPKKKNHYFNQKRPGKTIRTK